MHEGKQEYPAIEKNGIKSGKMFASALAFKIEKIPDRDDYMTMNSVPGGKDGEGDDAPPADLE